MDRIAISKRGLWAADEAVRVPLRLLFLSLLVGVVSCLLVFASGARAFKVVSEAGEGAGQTQEPEGVAVDFETGRLFVADRANNRIDVFDATGAFEKAFGWGVKNGEAKLQTCTILTTCRKGLEGAGAGEFKHPDEIAVDNSPTSSSRHDVYVADSHNQRIEKFDSQGNFILTFGGGVDETVPGNVCTAESGHTCGAGSEGFKEGEFSSHLELVGNRPIFVGVGPGGVVYVADDHQEGVADGHQEGAVFQGRLQRFEPSGVEIAPEQILFEGNTDAVLVDGLAVDSTGDFYVNTGGAIRKYEPAGGPIAEIKEPFGGEALTGAGAVALAIGPEDDLFAASTESSVPARVSIMEFDPAGNRLRRFGFGSFLRDSAGLAPYHSATGDIYASEPIGEANGFDSFGYRVLHLDFPEPGPLVFPEPCKADPLGNTTATLDAELNSEGKATTYHFQYVTDATFQEDVAKLGAGHGFDHAIRVPGNEGEDPSLTADFKLHPGSVAAALAPETKYHCRVIAKNADGVVTGEEGVFTSKPPVEIGPGWSTGVGTETAVLNAEVNPLGIETTGYFEYVTEASYQKDVAELGTGHGFDHASKAPDIGTGEEPIAFGAEESFKLGAVTVSGLKPGTTYRYRIVATDHYFPAGFDGATDTFRTYATGGGVLSDGRAWELVSPGEKNSAEVAIPGFAGGFFGERDVRIEAAAGSGEAVTYTSWTSFGDPKSAPNSSQYLSKRTATGWGTDDISPFGFIKNPVEPPYRGFTPDLGFGAFVVDEPPLTPEAQHDSPNLYLRNDETGQLQALTIEEPQLSGGQGFCSGYAGVSADGKHAFFAGKGAMAGAPVGEGFDLYEWSAGEPLKLVSVLPDGSPAPPVPSNGTPGTGTGFGAAGGTCSMDQAIVHNAVSADGQTVFWSDGGEYENPEHEVSKQPLFARIDSKETIQLDAKPKTKAGKGPFGQGRFWAATSDGSKAFFTAPGNLTKDAEAAGGLYRYDTFARTLIDLTPGAVAPEIEGVTGVSEDGAYAYFVAKGALTGEEENPAGEKAVQGANNLYLYHENEPLRFIATLSDLDASDWSSDPEGLSARVTPGGRHLAFLTVETQALSGFDNKIFPGTHCQPTVENGLVDDPRCAEAYLYDAEAKTLTCASCNPAGSRPAGPAGLPGWTNPYEGPRYLSDDGSRLFFESRDALSATDRNGKRDVYEYEREGAGACSSESAVFDPASGGCVSLVSNGKSTDESYLLDASANGRDVFFSTRSTLVGWDQNENYDVYDAREGGGFPEPPAERQACSGEACKPSASLVASPFSPATAAFLGAGNLLPEVAKPGVKPKLKPLTGAQKLAKALKQCKKNKVKKKRVTCEKSAHKRYGRKK